MKKLVLAIAVTSAILSAEVPFETPQTSGGLMLSIRPQDSSLQVFVRTSSPETIRFRVTVVVETGSRREVLREEVNKYPDTIPGAFWTVLSIPTVLGRPEHVLNVSIEELTAPRTTDFR